MSSSTSPSDIGSSDSDARAARQRRRDGDHVVIGDGAHVADRLGDDQVGSLLLEPVAVELVQRAPRGDGLAHGAVDLAPPTARPGRRCG